MNKKTMTKDRSNVAITGVCSGVADYFNIDVSLVRILTVVGAIFFPVILIVYIVLAFALPYNTDIKRNNETVNSYKNDENEYEYNEDDFKFDEDEFK